MGRRHPNLWKPDEYEKRDQETVNRGYAICSKGMCTNLVSHPGDVCPQHKAEHKIDRSPGNHRTF